jgi:hypothetical protein
VGHTDSVCDDENQEEDSRQSPARENKIGRQVDNQQREAGCQDAAGDPDPLLVTVKSYGFQNEPTIHHAAVNMRNHSHWLFRISGLKE